MRIVVLGPPGAGKGTQAAKLSQHFSIPHISTGEIFRKNISEGTEIGKLAKSYIDKGDLVPHQVTVDMVAARLSEIDAMDGFILDGFPRAVDQAVALQKILVDIDGTIFNPENHGQGLDAVLSFEIADEVIISRLQDRGRADDNEETIRNRLTVYAEQTTPLLAYYANFIREIDAVGVEAEVFARTLRVLGAT